MLFHQCEGTVGIGRETVCVGCIPVEFPKSLPCKIGIFGKTIDIPAELGVRLDNARGYVGIGGQEFFIPGEFGVFLNERPG